MTLKNNIIKFTLIVTLSVIYLVALGLIARFFLIQSIRDMFGPPRSELVEPSIFEHLTTTCFEDDTVSLCDKVSLDIIRDRIQPELTKHELIFIDYIGEDILKYGDILDASYADMPEINNKTMYLLVSFHILIAKDANNQFYRVIVPFETIKSSDFKLYHFPLYTTLNYEAVLLCLKSKMGEFVIFEHTTQQGIKKQFKITLSEHMFAPYKTFHDENPNEIRLFIRTHIEIETDQGWDSYPNPVMPTYGIMVVYDGEKLSIYNHDYMMELFELLFEYPLSEG
jgi:hypothetical protein